MSTLRAFDDEAMLAAALDRALGRASSPPESAGASAPELSALVSLAQRIETSAVDVRPDPTFRLVARRRLLASLARSSRSQSSSGFFSRVPLWAARFAAGLAALSVAGAAAASASASALPGEPLYAVKQASEALAIQAAPSDSARQELLLEQADKRLDETTRLLAQGREEDAAADAERYDQTLAAATMRSPASDAVETHLRVNETRLTELVQTAPPAARHGLEVALQATQRGLARGRPAPPELVRAQPIATPAVVTPTAAPTPTPPGQSLSRRVEGEGHDDTGAVVQAAPEHARAAAPTAADHAEDAVTPDEPAPTPSVSSPATPHANTPPGPPATSGAAVRPQQSHPEPAGHGRP